MKSKLPKTCSHSKMNILVEMTFSTAHKGPANINSTITGLMLPVYLDAGKSHILPKHTKLPTHPPRQTELFFPNYQQLFNGLLSKSVFRHISKILKSSTLLPEAGKIFQICFCCYSTKSSIKARLKSTADCSLQTLTPVLTIISVIL